MNVLKQLEGIKDKLEKAKEEKANIQGQISSKVEQLVELGFKDTESLLDDVKEELVELDKQKETLIQEFEEKLEAFKTKFPMLFED